MSVSYDEKLRAYDALIAAVPGLARKGKTMAYTSMNGNMFSFLSQGGRLAFRLSKADREDFLARYPDAVVEEHGTVMKDYVEVPDGLLADPAALRQLFELSVENARNLKPKATTRRKPAASGT